MRKISVDHKLVFTSITILVFLIFILYKNEKNNLKETRNVNYPKKTKIIKQKSIVSKEYNIIDSYIKNDNKNMRMIILDKKI